MTRLILPLILVAAALGLFVAYTNPTYQASKALSMQVASYNDALTKSQELKSLRDQLLAKRNTFSTDEVNNLQKVLPNNVDNIRLIIDINNIAARHNLALSNVQLGSINDSASARSTLASGSSGSPIGSVEVGFTINASYETMLSFLEDLEHSLRLIDVTQLSFAAAGHDHDAYTFTIRTYWLH